MHIEYDRMLAGVNRPAHVVMLGFVESRELHARADQAARRRKSRFHQTVARPFPSIQICVKRHRQPRLAPRLLDCRDVSTNREAF
jgi:hypothetical protein